MRHYADVTKESLDCDFADCEVAGAAGGLGYAFLSYLAGELIPGVELILQATGLEEKMKSIMGTRVQIHRKKNDKGKIEIEYYSKDELERIIDLFESIG